MLNSKLYDVILMFLVVEDGGGHKQRRVHLSIDDHLSGIMDIYVDLIDVM